MPASRTPWYAILARITLIPYIVGVALIVWLPASMAGKVTGIAFRLARWVSAQTDIPLTTTYTVFEFAANIALFVPLGFLLALGWPHVKGWVIILLGYSATSTVELVQTLLPSRYPSLSDVIANTLGTIIGLVLVRMFRSAPSPTPVRRERDDADATLILTP